jgi:hypothetical protein
MNQWAVTTVPGLQTPPTFPHVAPLTCSMLLAGSLTAPGGGRCSAACAEPVIPMASGTAPKAAAVARSHLPRKTTGDREPIEHVRRVGMGQVS